MTGTASAVFTLTASHPFVVGAGLGRSFFFLLVGTGNRTGRIVSGIRDAGGRGFSGKLPDGQTEKCADDERKKDNDKLRGIR